jgi:non-heme chloroperoxidase
MIANRFGELEVLVRSPRTGPARATPLLFVHGAYGGAWCWDENFLPYFAEQGYEAYALSLSGHGETRRSAPLDSFCIDDYVQDVAQVVAALPAPPILIGHSMGGMVVQKFLERRAAAGTVLLASVPPQGLWSATVGLMFRNPGLLQDLNSIMSGGGVDISSVRDGLFHQEVELEKLNAYCLRFQAESHRAIWDMMLFNLPRPDLVKRVPMLVLGAEHDRLIPPSLVEMTALTYGLRAEIVEGMGHGMMLERDWEAVAARIAGWLADLDLEEQADRLGAA